MNRLWLKIRTSFVVVFLASIYFGTIALLVSPDNIAIFAAAALSVLSFLVGQYFIGTRAALRSVGARQLDDSMVTGMVEQLADEMGVPEPDVYLGRMGSPNAFAVGRKGKGKIVVSETLVQLLPPRELEAVLAHEMSHLRSRDTTAMLLGHSLHSLIRGFSHRILNEASGFIGGVVVLVATIVGTILHVVVLVPIRSISRYREYIADWDAARFTGNPDALASALSRISAFHARDDVPEPSMEVNELCVFSADRSLTDRLIGTHPPIEHRIDRLESFDENGDVAYEE